MTLKEFFVKLGLDVDAQSFARGQLAVNGLQSVLGLLARGAQAAGRWLAAIGPHTAEYADNVAETAQRTGVGVVALQELAYAGKFSGLSMGDLATSLKFLNKNMVDAADGGKETRKAFADLGIKDIGKGGFSSAEDMLERIADKFASMDSVAEKTSLAMRVFGRSGVQLIPFLNAGAEGIAKLRKEAHELGLVLDEDQIRQGEAAADAMDRLKSAYEGVKLAAGAALLPALKGVADAVTTWLKANRELVKARIVAIIKALGTAFKALWMVLKPLVRLLGFVIDHLAEAAAIIGGLLLASLTATTFAAANAAGGFLAMGLAAAKSGAMAFVAWLKASVPVLALAAVFALVILLVEDLYTALKGGDSLVQKIWDKWEGFLESWSQPKDGDGWLKKSLRFLVYAILNLNTVWDDAVTYWRGKLEAFFSWVAAKWDKVRDVLPEALGGKSGAELAGEVASGKRQMPSGVDSMLRWVASKSTGSPFAKGFDPTGQKRYEELRAQFFARGQRFNANSAEITGTLFGGPETVRPTGAVNQSNVTVGTVTVVTPDPAKSGEAIEQKLREMEDRANRALSDGVD